MKSQQPLPLEEKILSEHVYCYFENFQQNFPQTDLNKLIYYFEDILG
jgi:hypothetical protein